MMACSALEVANKIAALQGIAPEPGSPTTKRCSRIYNECFPQEGMHFLLNINNIVLSAPITYSSNIAVVFGVWSTCCLVCTVLYVVNTLAHRFSFNSAMNSICSSHLHPFRDIANAIVKHGFH